MALGRDMPKHMDLIDPQHCMDLHVHSSYSSDGTAKPVDILKTAKKMGLAGVAIVDHNNIKGGLEAARLEVEGVFAIPGIEITSKDGGHILAFGLAEEIPRGLAPAETVERIRELGGVPIAPHPYRFWSGLGEETTRQSGVDILEVLNARSVKKHNQKALNLAKDMGTGMTGGSDAHDLEHIGRGLTRFPNQPSSVDDALQMLEAKKTVGEGLNRPSGDTMKYVLKSVSQWMGRGMRRM